MGILRLGAEGPFVELLQYLLTKVGFYTGLLNGIYDDATKAAVICFQQQHGLRPTGLTEKSTWLELMPFFNGYDIERVKKGDTLSSIAAAYGTTVARIMTANTGLDLEHLQENQKIIVPTGTIIPTQIRYSYDILVKNLDALQTIYPFLEVGSIGTSALHREIPYIKIGTGKRKVFYNAAFHANEWITALVLMKFVEQFALAYTDDTTIYGYRARDIFDYATIYLVPMVNPDGVDLVTGALASGSPAFERAKRIADEYPEIPFPYGWKANIDGIDLNLQYPARWEMAKDNKYQQGFTKPAPRDYVGAEPLIASEAKAVYDFTRAHEFDLILAYHTQGEVIYWKYLDYLPPYSDQIGQMFANASGYELEETPYLSGFAGYKDWFIQTYNRPGYTIEAGRGISPLPISQLDPIYQQNEGILVLGAVLAE